jgi:hypothetical protein
MATTHDSQLPPDETPIDGAPTWVRVLQAAAIGLIAGLALNALVSIVSVHGEGLPPQMPKECQKRQPEPDKDAGTPASAPTLGLANWTFEGLQARR